MSNPSSRSVSWRRLLALYWIVSALFSAIILAAADIPKASPPTDNLAEQFKKPPESCRPWVHWFWIDGNISKEGITADLEAMKRVGIGGVILMDITQEVPPGPVRFGSPEWQSCFQHAVAEASRLGLNFSINNDPGWSGSGGPWITPALSMQKLVWSTTNLSGPGNRKLTLPPAPAYHAFNRDVSVLAFPAIVGDGATPSRPPPKVSLNPSVPGSPALLVDGNQSTSISIPSPRPNRPQIIEFEFPSLINASLLVIAGKTRTQSLAGELLAAEPGHGWRTVREFQTAIGNVSVEFPSVRAARFRVRLVSAASPSASLDISEIQISPVWRIDSYAAKSGLSRSWKHQPFPLVPPDGLISPTNVIDLTSLHDGKGNLEWNVPPGLWTILRFASMPTGRQNPPARPGGLGLECDKLSKEAVEAHFNAFIGKLDESTRSAGQGQFGFTHIDSWEVGFQNWTPHFREEFTRLRGYDPLRYLPAFTGRYVGSAEISERFLWDVRRTIADLQATNYAGHLAALAHARGMRLSAEAYGNGPFDDLLYAGQVDIPMSEFWNETDEEVKFVWCKSMASAAHVYGKPVVAAEAFTAWPMNAKWHNHPFSLKPLADTAFTYGVNHLVIHRYAHQPWLDLKPGMTMGMWGVHYERTQTWWEQSKPWHDYLTRCQFLLRQGLFSAELCYVTPEGAFAQPPPGSQLEPPVPLGYTFDITSPDVVLNRMTADDEGVRLPDGMVYRVLVMSPTRSVTPELLRKLHDLVAAGAILWGPPPEKSPSLAGYPSCDIEVQKLTRDLWKNIDGKTVTQNPLGKGKVFWGRPLDLVLRDIGEPPAFHQLTGEGKRLRTIQRHLGSNLVWFVSNPNSIAVRAQCEFRATGLQPEFWYPDTGQIENTPAWTPTRTGTALSLDLAPLGSVFVVFRGPVTTRPTPPPTEQTRQTSTPPASFTLRGPWQLRFPPNLGAPPSISMDKLVSWTEHKDPGVRHFSGRATYSTRFTLPPNLGRSNQLAVLDLGRVCVIAQVRLNNQVMGIHWKPPFQIDISRSLRRGENILEVDVVNLWPNRLIGDDALPSDCQWASPEPGPTGTSLTAWPAWLTNRTARTSGRITFTTRRFYTPNSPLLESGLLGPVTISFSPEKPPSAI